jgi:hypothetical protein
MRRRPTTASQDAALSMAWWASLLATLLLIAILGLAVSAQAEAVPAAGWPGAPALALDDEIGDEEAEASEDEEFEAEECEDGEEAECEDDEAHAEAPPECLLSSARATVSAIPNRDRVRLQIGYTTTSPTVVAVAYGLHGARGSLHLGSEKRQFARQGVLRLTRSLTEAQMAKVMAARGFTVRLRAPAAPRHCQQLFERQLDVRRATPGGLVWQQSE